jgi:hypothetical protein
MKLEELAPTLSILAGWQGKPLNYSTVAKELGISHKAAKARILSMVEAGLIWLLYPLPAQARSKGSPLRKTPKLYLRGPETGLPFQSRMIRSVCALESARSPSSSFWYCGGYGKAQVELIVQTALKRIGFVFLQENRLSRWCWSYCKRVLRQDMIQGGFVLYPGRRIFFAAERLVALPAAEFFEHYRRWMNACLGASRKLLVRMVREYNSAHAGLLP